MKFGTNKTAHLELGDSHVTKRENLKNSRWRTAAILKIVLAIHSR